MFAITWSYPFAIYCHEMRPYQRRLPRIGRIRHEPTCRPMKSGTPNKSGKRDKIDIPRSGRLETGCRLLCIAMIVLREALIRLAGSRSLLLLGDTLVLDRWRWVEQRLPAPPASLVDVGCGNGWLAINCSRLGYGALGLGWNGPDLAKAKDRAARFGSAARFEVQDVRTLSARRDLTERFDIVTCLETIEHVLDDARLMVSLANILRPGGQLILTTPNEAYIPMDAGDAGPFSRVEDGGHVRKGYTADRLRFLTAQAGLEITEIGFCSSWYSQRVTGLLRRLNRYLGYVPAWAVTLPLRAVPTSARWRRRYPSYSICVSAIKSQ